MNLEQIGQWETFIALALNLGVRSWDAITGMMEDAGLDDQEIATLTPKWDALLADIKASAGES